MWAAPKTTRGHGDGNSGQAAALDELTLEKPAKEPSLQREAHLRNRARTRTVHPETPTCVIGTQRFVRVAGRAEEVDERDKYRARPRNGPQWPRRSRSEGSNQRNVSLKSLRTSPVP